MDKACPGPTFAWVFTATALSCSASLDFLSALIRGAVVNNRAAVVSFEFNDTSKIVIDPPSFIRARSRGRQTAFDLVAALH